MYCVATTIRGIPLEQKLKLMAQTLSFIAKFRQSNTDSFKDARALLKVVYPTINIVINDKITKEPTIWIRRLFFQKYMI